MLKTASKCANDAMNMGFVEWYSHQELNLDQRFRKPLLYPFELWEQWRTQFSRSKSVGNGRGGLQLAVRGCSAARTASRVSPIDWKRPVAGVSRSNNARR